MSIVNLPVGATVTYTNNPSAHPTATICWIPGMEIIGTFCFNIFLNDNNACGQLSKTEEFCIKVICRNCPLDIIYEHRSVISGNPLPSMTRAPRYVIAGEDVASWIDNGPVIVGTGENVTFKAGVRIDLEPGFYVNDGIFEATIDPLICLEEAECTDCCDDWNGFSDSIFIPNVFTPNGDGWNDVWKVNDYANRYCAYKATCFELDIFNRWGQRVHKQYSYPTTCCPYESAVGPNDPTISSINWNGRNFGTGALLAAGVYYYVLRLCGCNGEDVKFNGTIEIVSPEEEPFRNDNYSFLNNENSTLTDLISIKNSSLPYPQDSTQMPFVNYPAYYLESQASYPNTANNATESHKTHNEVVFPNPNNGSFQVYLAGEDTYPISYEIFNKMGELICKKNGVFSNLIFINLYDVAAGLYYLKINYETKSRIHKIAIIH